jgi:hypothetical protein
MPLTGTTIVLRRSPSVFLHGLPRLAELTEGNIAQRISPAVRPTTNFVLPYPTSIALTIAGICISPRRDSEQDRNAAPRTSEGETGKKSGRFQHLHLKRGSIARRVPGALRPAVAFASEPGF